MILKKHILNFNDNNSSSYITQNQLLSLLDTQEYFKEKLIDLYQIDENETEVIQVGNSKSLLDSLLQLNDECEKIDITSQIKDIQLKKMLQEEKALFEVFNIKDESIINKTKSDKLEIETAYSAKHDILDYYNFSRFANYCRDYDYHNLINVIKEYLKKQNTDNSDSKNLRILYKKDERKFFLRAVTSTDGYQDFGLNFSVFIALIVLSRYSLESKNEVFIDKFIVDDSTIYVSFSLSEERAVNKNLSLSFNLILENDEIKRSAVAFNGVFKLKYQDKGKTSEIFLKPKGIKKNDVSYPVDLLTYRHKGNVKTVFNKLKELPDLIDYFIKQVADDTSKISEIKNPKDVRVHLANKVRRARTSEFQKYKTPIFNKLMKMTVDNTYNLFEIFREVDELFENEDVVSRDYWRTKLYESLVEKK